MRRTSFFTAIGFAVLAGGIAPCTASTGVAGPDAIDIRLQATLENAGKIGSAVIRRAGKDSAMLVTISGLPVYTTQPTDLHTFVVQGTCAQKGAQALALKKDVLVTSQVHPIAVAFRGPVQMSYPVALPFDSLRSAPFAVSVRLGSADGGREVFCGDFRGA